MIETIEYIIYAPYRIFRRISGAWYWEERFIEENRRAEALEGIICHIEKANVSR